MNRRTAIHAGDCVAVMKRLAGDGVTVDAVVTDPPYHLVQTSRGGSQRVAGTGPFARHTLSTKGFMGKEWDGGDVAFRPETWKAALDVLKPGGRLLAFAAPRTYHRMACAIEDAGFAIEDQMMWIFGSGFPKHRSKLKPAHEPIVVARKPGPLLPLNIDGCRVDAERRPLIAPNRRLEGNVYRPGLHGARQIGHTTEGRYPANVMHDGSAEVLDAFAAFGERQSRPGRTEVRGASVNCYGAATRTDGPAHDDTGTAARFFYCPKASKKERAGSKHPTVKPLALMRYLCRLVTPPGGVVLDPFAGTGTTGEAARLEGFRSILIERDADYLADIRTRLKRAA
jgi:site-specific DNA-methyltransferase (adenine-specific)